MEQLEDLLINNFKIYQDDSLYHFTSDSVLLSKFASVKNGDVVADFCSGSGIVGLHLYALNSCIKSVTFFEMQKELYDLSVKTIAYNKLQQVFSAENTKIQDIDNKYHNYFSLIVCNPPYMEVGENAKTDTISICKTEIFLKLEELISKATKCLKFGGRFAIVHRADRLVDIVCLMRKYKLEPKKMQFVYGGKKEPYLVMIEGVKGGKVGLKALNSIEN